MNISNFSIKLFLVIGFLFSCSVASLSQEPTPTPTRAEIEDDVLKINTKLIQTGVFVTNKKGDFIDNLTKDDFEVRVDNKPVSTLFFDKVIAGKKNLAPDNKQALTTTVQPAAVIEQGRVMIFLVDDYHLSFESHKLTRQLILKFIDNEMLDNDLIAIVSSSNKIGFLQQFTNNKDVLRAATGRIINNRNTSGKDNSAPPMSEYEALAIDRLDRQVTDLFVSLTEKTYSIDRRTAEMTVQSRAQSVLAYARVITQNTVSILEQSIKKASVFPGRKAVFFISDGFLADTGNTDLSDSFKKISDAAVRSNTVIYSFDAKGLDAGLPEGTTADAGALGFSIQAGSRFENQDGLSYLANNTGGQFIHNTNDMKSNLTKVTQEAFTYYLLAWEPEEEISKSDKLKRITISINGRPELKVRTNSGYLSEKSTDSNKQIKKAKEVNLTEEQKLIAVTNFLNPKQQIPLHLTARYLDFPNEGGVFSATLQVDSNALKFVQDGNEATANLEMVGLIYNSDGKQVNAFKSPLKVSVPVSKLNESGNPDFNYEFQMKLNPGLYQMRVAIRDVKSGYIGSVNQWLEIPDLSSRKLTLSSLSLGEKKNIAAGQKNVNANNDPMKLQPNTDHRFENASSLRFLGFIYNSAYGQGKTDSPDITIQAQILKQGSVLINFPGQLTNLGEKDAARLPYTGEIFLNKLPVGHYELKVSVTDRAGKSTAIKSAYFEIK
jgi:VWFA-related protein